MLLEPAHVNAVRQAEDGRFDEISADAGTVAADLAALDAGLKVRLKVTDVPRGREFFAVFHENHPGCPHNSKDSEGKDLPAGSTYLVTSVRAHQNSFGVWEGLDQRIVDRFHQINPAGRGHYDYAAELERANRKAGEERKKNRAAMFEETAEQAAHALRKDLGVRYRGRAFIPRDVP